METEAWEKRAEEYRELVKEMCENNLAPNLPHVKSLFLGWFEPLTEAIDKEQRLQESKRQKASYAPYIGLLPADKMAVIVMHKMMGLLMVGPDEGSVRLVQAAVYVGDAIEQEVRIHNFLERSKKFRGRKKIDDDDEQKSTRKEGEIRRQHVEKLIKPKKLRQVQKLLKNDEDIMSWGQDAQAKLGSCLIKLLIEAAYVQPPVNQLSDCQPEIWPAFSRKGVKRCGFIECDPLARKGLHSTARHMVIPPRNWKGYGKSGQLFLPSYVMRTHGARQQQDAIRKVPKKQMQKVFEVFVPEKPLRRFAGNPKVETEF